MTTKGIGASDARQKNSLAGKCHVCDCDVPAQEGRIYRQGDPSLRQTILVRCEVCHKNGWGSPRARLLGIHGQWGVRDVNSWRLEMGEILPIRKGEAPRHAVFSDTRRTDYIRPGDPVPDGWVQEGRLRKALLVVGKDGFWPAAFPEFPKYWLLQAGPTWSLSTSSLVMGRFMTDKTLARLKERVREAVADHNKAALGRDR